MQFLEIPPGKTAVLKRGNFTHSIANDGDEVFTLPDPHGEWRIEEAGPSPDRGPGADDRGASPVGSARHEPADMVSPASGEAEARGMKPSEFRKARPDLDFKNADGHAAAAIAYEYASRAQSSYVGIGVDHAAPAPEEGRPAGGDNDGSFQRIEEKRSLISYHLAELVHLAHRAAWGNRGPVDFRGSMKPADPAPASPASREAEAGLTERIAIQPREPYYVDANFLAGFEAVSPEIEVTPEMIAAGAGKLEGLATMLRLQLAGYTHAISFSAEAAAIYRAMEAERRKGGA